MRDLLRYSFFGSFGWLLMFLSFSPSLARAEAMLLDNSFAAPLYGYGQVTKMVWNPVSEWLYCQVVAERLNGQDLTTNLIRFDADGNWDATWALEHDGEITCIAMQSDGKLLIGGDFSQVDGHITSRVARINLDGSIDTSFVCTGIDSDYGRIEAMAANSSGTIFVGFLETDEFWLINELTTLKADGSSTFGSYNIENVRTIAIAADDTVYVGGDSFYKIAPGFTATEFHADIEFTNPWDSVATPVIYKIETVSDGLWVAGLFDEGLVKLDSSGNVVQTIDVGTNSSSYAPLIFSFLLYNNEIAFSGAWFSKAGKFLVGTPILSGSPIRFASCALIGDYPVFGAYNPYRIEDNWAIYFMSLGDLSESIYLFKAQMPKGFSIGNEGKIYLFGTNIFEVFTETRPGLLALNDDGALDHFFSPQIDRSDIQGLLELPDGRILIAGSIALPGEERSDRILLLRKDGTVINDVDLHYTGQLGASSGSFQYPCIWLMPTGKVLIGNYSQGITSINGTSTPGLVLLDFSNLEAKLSFSQDPWQNGIIDTNFLPLETVPVRQALGLDDGCIIIGSSSKITKYNPDGSIVESYNPASQFSSFHIHDMKMDSSGRLYLTKGSTTTKYTTLDGTTYDIVRLMPDGSIDTEYSFKLPTPALVRDIDVTPSGILYLTGSFFLVDTVQRYFENGERDVSFSADDGAFAFSTKITPEYYYILTSDRMRANWGRYPLPVAHRPNANIIPTIEHADEGDDITFWLADRGAEETYQWLSNGAALAGQTGPSLTLDPATLANAGVIGVQATGPGGSVTRTATLNVTGYDFAQWGAQQGYTESELADPDADLNSDGFSLNDEYLLRTDLFGPATRTWASPVWDDGALTIQFTMLPGRRYWIDCSTNLVDWTPIDSYTSDASEPVAIEVEFDPETPCFYQVRVEAI